MYSMVVLTQIIIVITIKCFSKHIHVNNLKILSYDKIGVLILTTEVHQKIVSFAIIGIFYMKDLSFNQISAMPSMNVITY